MKFLVLVLSAVWILMPNFIHAQINDCADAVVVCSNADLGFNPIGPGMDDFADPDNFPGCMVALEQNSAWYYFQIDPTAPPNLVLGFIIHPKGGLGEDYDWALFGPNVDCGNLGLPIRCSSSSAACGFCPETGMGMGTTDVTEGPGTGDGFVMTLIVQPGQGFYLLIDNWQGTMNGFILEWTDTAAPYLNCAADPPCALGALAGPDINACEGNPGIVINGGATGEHGNEVYTWTGTNGGTAYLNDPSLEDPTISLPGGFTGTITYTLVVEEDGCIGEDEFILTVFPLPVVTITQIGPFCQNNLPQALSGTPAGGTWGGAATGNMFNPATNGPGIHTVTYTYTNSNNCTNMASIDIEVYVKPEVVIDPNPADFCDSENSILLTATGSSGSGSGYMYSWTTPSGPETGDTYNATLSGTHTVTVTDENGCTSTGSTIVTSYANPTVEIINPSPICESEASVILVGNPPGGEFIGPNITPAGELIPGAIGPGTFSITYTYTNANNCEGTDVEDITIIPVPVAIAGNNGPLCEGQTVLLFGETDGTGTMVTYNWTGPNGYASTMQNPTDATLGGTYVLQVIIDNCPSLYAVTDVLLTPKPDALAVNDGPYCNGQTVQLSGSTSSMGFDTTYSWIGPSGYTSDVQNPMDATVAGTYALVITIDGCVSDTVQTDVIFNAPPDAMATNTGPYCQGDLLTLLGNTSASGGVITYTWTGPNGYASNAQNPIDAFEPGSYKLVVDVDGCMSPTAATTITIHPLPQPVITGQNSFCTGSFATIDAGFGYSNYLWDDASTNQTLQVNTSGTYNVTVTDMNGCTGTASFAVTEMASLMPIITGLLGFCEGSSTTLDAGGGYTNYMWSTGGMSQTIQVTTAGNFGVVVTDADGCTGSATVSTTINLNPVVTIGGSTTYCIGGFTTLDAGTGYMNYTWSTGETSQTIIVSSPGDYSVDVIDNFGCAGSGMITITESTSLSPIITGINRFCENGSTTLNAGSGFDSYIWSDGSMNQNLVVNVAGIYSVTVADNQGCSGNSSVTVTEVAPPVAQVQTGTTLCNTVAGGSVINMYSLVLAGDMNGTWMDVDNSGATGLFTNLNFTSIAAGDYRFNYTTKSAVAPCPESVYQVIVTIIDCTCPDVFFFNAAPLCNAGDILDVSTIENTNEQGSWSVIQTPAGTNPATLIGTIFNATASDTGDYILQFVLQNQPPPGCPMDFQVIVNVGSEVDAGVAAAPVSFCANDNQLVSLVSLLIGADANGSWTETSLVPSQGIAFDAANGTFRTNNQVAGSYTFQYNLTGNGACPPDATEVSVIINPLPTAVIAGNNALDCINAAISLDASGSSSGPDYDIVWTGPGILVDGNELSLKPTINKAGDYMLTITNRLTGCKQSATVNVVGNTEAPSTAQLNTQNPSCFGDQNGFIQIGQVIGGASPFNYSLNSGPFIAGSSFNNLSAGNHHLVIQDANGCRWDTILMLVEPPEFNINLGPDIELELGESAMIQAIISPPSVQIGSLVWTPDNLIECIDILCLEGIIHTYNSVSLTATIIDIFGCRDTDEINIHVNKNRKIYIPTAFSPNGDGINDLFYVIGDARQIVKIKKFMVFNRWGDQLHEANNVLPNDPQSGWDGSFKNEKLNPDVFVYFVEIEYIDGVVEVLTGDVTVVR